RPLRTLPGRQPRRRGERDHRPGVLRGDRQGTPRGVPGRHGAGDPAHHRRNQAPDARSGRWRRATAGRDHHRDRGTVGDIESQPFLEAARQVRQDVGRDNVFFVHVSLIPYLGPSGELKTKPTQHSVAALRSIGIQPDAIVCRADRDIPEPVKHKIASMCDVDREAVITCVDAPSIYDIPKVLHSEGLDAYVIRRLAIPFRDVDWDTWHTLLERVHHPVDEVEIALVGKYIDLPDAYLSVTEAIRAGGFHINTRVKLRWVPSDDCATP